jgi:spore coat polysaccharide biosynthesis protein SpsF
MILPFYKGWTMVELIIERFKDELDATIPFIIATTDRKPDDEIERIAREMHVNYFRGSENDVLDRFIRAAEKFNLQTIIRVCADNPFFDIQGTIALTSLSEPCEWDYIGYKVKDERPTILTHSGFWGEVVTLEALKRAHEETTEAIYREHVTNYIHQHPDKFRVMLVNAPDALFFRDDIRLTVDTHEDFVLIQEIYLRLIEKGIQPQPEKIVEWIDRHPDYLARMKAQIEKNKK